MYPKLLLRVEGLTVFAAATAAYFTLGGPVWLFLLLILAPDVSMLGYLAGPRVGSVAYNAFHTYAFPAGLGALGVWSSTSVLVSVALVWAAHIGMDRTVGYGLKYPSGFTDTHLSHVGTGDAGGIEPLTSTRESGR